MKLFSLISLFIISFSVIAQNPIVPPGLNIPDPTAKVWKDGKLYVYGSRDDNPKTYCSHDYWVLSTSDLINWEYHPNAFSSDKVPYNPTKPLYAPSAIYKDGLYYLYYCQPGKGNNEGVATSTSPVGPFGDAKVMNIPARYNQIDPGVFIDDDGQAYYTWGQFSAKVAKLMPNMTEIDTTTIIDGVLTGKDHHFHEGNTIIKRNGIYYMVYAHNGRELVLHPDGKQRRHPTCIGYATSQSPMGPYTYGGVIIDNKGCNPGNHNNHGSIVEFKGQWYVFYHRSTHGSKMMRKACIEPIKFLKDGSIPEVKMTSQGAGGPLDAFSPIEAERACLLSGNVRIETFSFNPDNLVDPTNNDQLAQIKNGDNAAYISIDFGKGASLFSVTAASESNGGKIELRTGSLDGPVIGTCHVTATGGWNSWKIFSCNIKKVSGVHELYLVFTGDGDVLFNLDKFQFFNTNASKACMVKPDPIREMKTAVTIEGEKFMINGMPTYQGITWETTYGGEYPIEGLLMNSRMVQGIFDDVNPMTRGQWIYPDTRKWDADRNTGEFIDGMASWKENGLLAFTLNLQGGCPYGYCGQQPWDNSAFAPDGSLRQDFMDRLELVLNRADDLGMVVILGYFYFGQDQRLVDEAAIIAAVENASKWVLNKGYKNVIVEISNEGNHKAYDHEIINSDRIHELIDLAKSIEIKGRRLYVSTSLTGGAVPPGNIVGSSDFVLLHGNGVKEIQRMEAMIKAVRAMEEYRPMPIVNNEDDRPWRDSHQGWDESGNNFVSAVKNYASWGYFDFRMKEEHTDFNMGYQSVPTNYHITTDRETAFFDLLAKITNSPGTPKLIIDFSKQAGILNVRVEGNADLSKIKKVEIIINNKVHTTLTNQPFTLKLTELPEGEHWVKARAKYFSGDTEVSIESLYHQNPWWPYSGIR